MASGFLTGKYRVRKDLEGGQTRKLLAKGYFTDKGLDVIDALSEIAEAHEEEIATVALAWLLCPHRRARHLSFRQLRVRA